MNKINIPKFYYHKKTLYIDKETYNRDVMKVKEYKEEELDKYKEVLDKIKKIINNKAFFDPAMPNCNALGQNATLEILELLEEIE